MSDFYQQEVARLNTKAEADRKSSYSTRGNANRAARNACKKALGPYYQAFEGPDYFIHPVHIPGEFEDRYKFELRGPAAEAMNGTAAANSN